MSSISRSLCLEAVQWLGSQKDVKGYLCQALLSDSVSVPVHLLQEKTDRLASGNMEYVVCGWSTGVESSEH